MLFSLKIHNFALVDRLELDFDKGLNVLTGETGAGKSIILDAIDIALGGKVSSRMIRSGSDRATIEATFKVNDQFQQWLQKQAVTVSENSLICTRELTAGKGNRVRSRCRLNGNAVNRQLMEQLRSRLIEITVQGQTSDLLVPEKQRTLLDLYGGKPILKQKSLVAKIYAKWQQAKQKLAKRQKAQQETLQKQNLLEFQLKELTEAELTTEDELEQLQQERDRLSHVVELQQLSYQAYQLLYQSDADAPTANDLLGDAESNLEEMTSYDGKLQPILEMVQSAIAQVVEAGQQINSYGDSLEADPERLGEIEARIRVLKDICRKYSSDLGEVIAFYHKVKQELAELTDSEQSLSKLEAICQQAQQELFEVCATLSQLRQKAITKLERQLVKELKPLAMDKVVFECRLNSCQPTINGADEVVFYFSPNPGEVVQPLADTASGGEMSRFLLALKACFSDAAIVSNTLVFDEIDAGVSGKVAQAIAEKLHQLSQENQILCVTHQPLIAAMADSHYKVEKTIIEEVKKNSNGNSSLSDIRTVVRVYNISDLNLRIQELAQITGGHSADQAMEFAQSLLIKAADYRKKQQ
ncbi:DNA repair protein RecN [Hyella patelloides LEGE 07179]|uniref:DNA repair protein RecN n=1 Tax=Hyella patelloides LEGE 07179 TaxID=945734 RepID=A0A563VKT0_9CYAN|nr:DNA repair protein RecN [Hyella patelloides]VEP12021.1 DNA repair protein RecN [Hyella patelloides LEGE 07179]